MFNKNNAYGLHLPHPFHSAASAADEILFHHHEDILSGHYFAAAASPVVDAAAFFHNHQDHPSGLVNADLSSLPKTTKKDRHSKIYTSQGPRDRRVRLSIGVARRFFDLQEILGFDKPSKTLDWLLTNSKAAIKDLMETKETENAAAAVPSSPSECEEADSETGNFFGVSSSDPSKRKLSDRKCTSISDHVPKPLPSTSDLVKESRVKARARARERTREKMCIKQLHEDFNQLEFPNSSSNNFHSHPGFEAATNDHQDLIQIKRKVKHFISSSSNYGVPSPNYINPSENWDICAILDSHKFINSTSEN